MQVPSAQNVVMLLLVHGDVEQGHAMAVLLIQQYIASALITIISYSYSLLCHKRAVVRPVVFGSETDASLLLHPS